MANPTLLDMPIARDGNKNTIPTTDNGTTGLLSQQYGWQLINAIPPQQGGKAVKREDFNGALYLLSNLLFYLQKGWQFEWASSQTYYAGCVVKDTSDGKMYMCLNNVTSTTAPHSDTTNWKLWDLSMLANYLPLSGGTMTGDIKAVASRDFEISHKANDRAFYIMGGPDTTKNPYIGLFGGSRANNTGTVVIGAAKSDSVRPNILLLTPADTLIWRRTTDGENGIDLGGSAIVAKSLGTIGYVKYASGLILQWGQGQNAINTPTTINLPISYANNYTVVMSARSSSYNQSYLFMTVTANKLMVSFDYIIKTEPAFSGEVAFDWFTIGY